MPAGQNPMTQFQPYAWVRSNVADIACLHAMLRHKPELIADPAVAHRSAARLAGVAAGGFEQRISWRRDANRKEELNRRVEQVFLKRIHHPMLHIVSSTISLRRARTTLKA